MFNGEVLLQLLAWTPFLLEGFAWNLLIASTAAILGTGLGWMLVALAETRSQKLASCGNFLSRSLNQIPTFALMFYLAVLLPSEFVLPGTDRVIQIPNWIKAALALAASPAGFTAQNLGAAFAQWRRKEHSAALLFVPAWGMNVLITVIASCAASQIGVNEVLSRSNKLIAASQHTDLMVPLYLYVSLFFVVVCSMVMFAMNALRRQLRQAQPAI